MRLRARSAAMRHPCPKRAASPGSMPDCAALARTCDLLAQEFARTAIDTAHRIDHPALLAIDLAFDMYVEPPPGPMAIDEPLRKLVRCAFKSEDFVGPILASAAQPKRRILFS